MDAMTNGAKMITMTAIGDYVLVQSNIPLNAIAEYLDSELTTIMNLPEYRQPCKDCEI